MSAILLILFKSAGAQEIHLPKLKNNKSVYNLLKDKSLRDTVDNRLGKSKTQKANIGGFFISPMIGVSFPLGKGKEFSKSGIQYGVKIEMAYSRLYPLIFGFIYEYQKNAGNADFTTVNFLKQFDTKITSIGGGLDIILNKYLKSNFTTPILSLEVKYAKVSRLIAPETSLPDIVRDESLLTYTAGLGFTIYVFDLSGKYTYAKDYSNLSFQMRFHFPVVKF